MEIAGADGSKFGLNPGQIREFGRGKGLGSSDKTISRRQIAFFVPQFGDNKEIPVQFEVLGRNPIYVSRNGEVKIFRKFERGEMENGDMFCVSAKAPIWYTLKGVEACSESVRENDLAGDLNSVYEIKGVEDFQQGDVDISCIDPVADFGFLVIGNEFDLYHKKMTRDFKNWDWFLEETRRDSDDEDGKKGKKRGGKKRKKRAENEGEVWTGESEDDEVLMIKPNNAQRPKYATRSKDDRGKRSKATTKSFAGKKTREVDDEDEDEDEDDEENNDDETLGGFIVDDENLDEDEDEEEEEEEFEDDDDE